MQANFICGFLLVTLSACGLFQDHREHLESAKSATTQLFAMIGNSDENGLHRLMGGDLSGKFTVAETGSNFSKLHQYLGDCQRPQIVNWDVNYYVGDTEVKLVAAVNCQSQDIEADLTWKVMNDGRLVLDRFAFSPPPPPGSFDF